MNDKLHIHRKSTSDEVLARIVKATSHKYDCDLKIDFNNGSRVVEFVGDKRHKAKIISEIESLFGF